MSEAGWFPVDWDEHLPPGLPREMKIAGGVLRKVESLVLEPGKAFAQESAALFDLRAGSLSDQSFLGPRRFGPISPSVF